MVRFAGVEVEYAWSRSLNPRNISAGINYFTYTIHSPLDLRLDHPIPYLPSA